MNLSTLYPPDAPTCEECGRPYSPAEAKAGYRRCEHCPPDTDLCALPWVFETGEDILPATNCEPQLRAPYRTVFAIDPSWMDDRIPLADLAEDADDAVGFLMAAAPDLLAELREAVDLFEPETVGHGTVSGEWLLRAKIAIAKAEGGAP